MRVIIVDDEIKALQLFLSQIVDINLEYRFFKDDKNTILDFVKKNETSGAFLDINMPNINGFVFIDTGKNISFIDEAFYFGSICFYFYGIIIKISTLKNRFMTCTLN